MSRMSSRSVRVLTVLVITAIVVVLVIRFMPPSTTEPPSEQPTPSSAPAKKLIFQSETFDYIYTINPDGTEKKELGRGRFPQWSPDGKKITYQYAGSTSDEEEPIFLINADGTGKVKLDTGEIPSSYDVIFSPDGKRILYLNEDSRKATIFEVDTAGKVELEGFLREASWAPDGERLIYINGYDNLYVINADGTGMKGLTPEVVSATPGWSPDGKNIAYTKGGNYPDYEARVICADGTGDTVLGGHTGHWSPNGRSIAYISPRERHGPEHLKVIDFAEAGMTGDITTVASSEQGSSIDTYSWSPDGKNILYLTLGAGLQLGYHIVNLETGQDIYLGDRHSLGYLLTWSPDGQRLLSRCNGYSYVFNVDGTDRITLEGEDFEWSPDGKRLVYEYEEKFGSEVLGEYICIVNSDGTGSIELEGRSPVWSPDATRLAYTHEGCVYVINADGTSKTSLGEGRYPQWSPAFELD
jgi:Tol biopolymer transport system component